MNDLFSLTPASIAWLYIAIFLGGLGFPIFLEPLLLAVGISMKEGNIAPLQGMLFPLLCLCFADVGWYCLGRRHGMSSLDALAARYRPLRRVIAPAKDAFQRIGVYSLLYSRFVPGLTMAAPPMAGATNQPFERFVLCDALGIFLYTSLYIAIGYCFAGNFDRALDAACALCSPLPYFALMILTLICIYLTAAHLLFPTRRSIRSFFFLETLPCLIHSTTKSSSSLAPVPESVLPSPSKPPVKG
jgi:membrane protein DedA with SNARE-associated domain